MKHCHVTNSALHPSGASSYFVIDRTPSVMVRLCRCLFLGCFGAAVRAWVVPPVRLDVLVWQRGGAGVVVDRRGRRIGASAAWASRRVTTRARRHARPPPALAPWGAASLFSVVACPRKAGAPLYRAMHDILRARFGRGARVRLFVRCVRAARRVRVG